MRHWVFLHDTAEQFRTHTERMLELEQEYLRRHPQRLAGLGRRCAHAVARRPDPRSRADLLPAITGLLDDQPAGGRRSAESPSSPEEATTALLQRFAEAPKGRLHMLEAHQIARQISPDSHLVAQLYRQDPPLLQADRDMRVLTDAGRAWLERHSLPACGLPTYSVSAAQAERAR